MSRQRIRIAVAGVGNCASSLVQGVGYYAHQQTLAAPDFTGLMHPMLGAFGAGDIEVVAAFDIDARKVGQTLEDAIFAPPNNTKKFWTDLPRSDVLVKMGPVHDGVAAHMLDFPEAERFVVSDKPPVDLVRDLRDSDAEVLVNYLPVGSQIATEAYAGACLEAGVAFVNCVPCFVVSDPTWAKRFKDAGLPCVGDDIKAQLGATIVHRTLAKLFCDRGMKIDRTYQLNTGGNTDFLNMLNRSRLSSKKQSKTDAVQSQLNVPLGAGNIHIGPSDYVPFQKDNKVAFIRIEATGFGGIPMNLELRLSVEDSPNSAGSAIDAIRCCKLAKDAGMSGALNDISAWTMKHPPAQMSDTDAHAAVERFIGRFASRG